ncbi:hypothetical protein [Xylanimonas ulmi]|uniref:Uncharacterized protein n=1 Tax=Xylanimonas ulmi TaxID=228973 RepID=A0A4Q7M1C6_9MICO|nr:hypothetical protein [Xylanibacterium ulmi]RZS61204.1 hypothetical protein EV386_1495 [Xylanibacterium ulmi]
MSTGAEQQPSEYEMTEEGADELEQRTQLAARIGVITTRTVDLMPASVRDEHADATAEYTAAVEAATVSQFATKDALQAQFGSIEQSVIHLGHLVARRAEQLAGITAEQALAAWWTRLRGARRTARIARETREAVPTEVQRQRDAVRTVLLKAGRRHRLGILDFVYQAAIDQTRICECEGHRSSRESARRRLIAARVAYVTDPEVIDATSRVHDAPPLPPDDRALAVQRAERRLAAVEVGDDVETRADLARLAAGYLGALVEIRPMGGDHVFHPDSEPDAIDAYSAATAVFPEAWVEASNRLSRAPSAVDTESSTIIETSEPLRVSISADRARYSSGTPIDLEREVRGSEVRAGTHWEKDLIPGQNLSTLRGDYIWIPEGDAMRLSEQEPTAPAWEYWPHDVATTDDAGLRPLGSGWTLHGVANGQAMWRRPRHGPRRIERTRQPSSRTNAQDDRMPLPAFTATGGGPAGETFAVCVHELAHRFEEAVYGVRGLEGLFTARRATKADGDVAALTPIYADDGEVARDGGYVDPYFGREYSHGNFEVLSCGMQALFGGESGGLVGVGGLRTDLDHRAFVLGTLAGTGRTRDLS